MRGGRIGEVTAISAVYFGCAKIEPYNDAVIRRETNSDFLKVSE